MRVLVTGAAGTVGRLVVEELLGAGGWDVRVLTRDPERAALPKGAEVAVGDLSRPDSLRAALAGVERMYLFPVAETAREVVARAKAAGVRRVVVLSSGAVTGGMDTSFHLPVERAVEDSGLEWTHVRPGEFAMNKVSLWGPSIREERTVRHPDPTAAWFPVHERDIADIAVTALLHEGHVGAAYTLSGPQLLSLRQQAHAIASALGEEIHFEQVTPEEARELYLRQGGFAAANAEFLLGFVDYEGRPADPRAMPDFDPSALGPQPTARDVTGRPARTFAQWAHDHRDDFR
ncbi:SDR family oxidoreductase [Streptomyces oceani]|uniref:NmrA family transcriptional regulator n=1 Tax=Streptomyces oceani TaxID=1075402 RepID=A0A1E7KJH9_9ACTN|nr:NAD(P)H-binding protein [Streptomyces oceani]OEV04065.1 NmrA family transcriptional regulator [Streptomyces oceani]